MKGVQKAIQERITINFNERKLKLSQVTTAKYLQMSQNRGTTECSSKLQRVTVHYIIHMKSIQNKLKQP